MWNDLNGYIYIYIYIYIHMKFQTYVIRNTFITEINSSTKALYKFF